MPQINSIKELAILIVSMNSQKKSRNSLETSKEEIGNLFKNCILNDNEIIEIKDILLPDIHGISEYNFDNIKNFIFYSYNIEDVYILCARIFKTLLMKLDNNNISDFLDIIIISKFRWEFLEIIKYLFKEYELNFEIAAKLFINKEYELNFEIAAKLFINIANDIDHNLAIGNMYIAIENYSLNFPQSAINIIVIFPRYLVHTEERNS